MVASATDHTWEQRLAAMWRPYPRLGGAEWAERERVLGPDESNTPGPWRCVPWQRGILDALADPSLDWIVILKASQVGCSELIRCAIGRWALVDPGDVLWVMATEQAAKKAMRKLQAMFRNTPALRPLVSDAKRDTGLLEMVLTNGMRIVIGWAGSAQSLASDPFRYCVLDETGLYPATVGGHGSPIGLVEDRTKTWGMRRKIVLLSKPSYAEDLICQAYEETRDKRERRVPCPACGELQPLEWEQARWPTVGGAGSAATVSADPEERLAIAAAVETEQTAWYECLGCAGEIRDVALADADPRSEWAPLAEVSGEARRRALRIPETIHWVTTPSDLAARFLRAIKPQDAQNFSTGALAKPHVIERGAISPELFRSKAIHPPGVVPSWATVVLATADTQKDHWWLLVRAWGRGRRSRLVDFCRVETAEELVRRGLEHAWPVEGSGATVRASLLLIDAGGGDAGGALDGSRSQVVYELAETVPHVIACKGSGEKRGAHEGQPLTWTTVELGGRRERSLSVCQPHANYWKDELAARVKTDEWEESTQAADPIYGRHMTGQVQVYEQAAGRNSGRWVWRKRGRQPDHLWDASYMQVVACEVVNAEEHETTLAQEAARGRAAAARNRLRERDEEPGWVGPFRGGRW